MEIFSIRPQKSMQIESAPDVAVVKLGDGYEQRQVKGINPLLKKYSLVFKGADDKCRDNNVKIAEDFIKARMAVESFYWTPPDTGEQGIYVCRSWSINKNGAYWELTTTFEQVPR